MDKLEIHSSADMFVYKAEIDLNTAKYLLEAFNADKIDIDIEKIYFELQQCSEKCFKALLSKENIRIPKIHDLEELIELCVDHNIYLIDNLEVLTKLNDYAVEGRYSIIHDDINDSENFIKLLEIFLKYIRALKND
ncbi:HEPN domain-containing protein [Sulfurimonas sp.]